MKPAHGRSRVVIEEVSPQIDAGRYPVCRIAGDTVAVTAAIFADGHDHLGARLLYRYGSERRWSIAPMTALGNDLWTGSFQVDKLETWSFTVEGWIDHYDTWASDLKKRLAAQSEPGATPQDIPLRSSIRRDPDSGSSEARARRGRQAACWISKACWRMRFPRRR